MVGRMREVRTLRLRNATAAQVGWMRESRVGGNIEEEAFTLMQSCLSARS